MPEEIDLALDERGSALGSLQKAVGGCIEPFNILFNGGIDLYINDEGLFTCPPNRAIYATEAMEETGYLSQLDYATPVKEGELYTILHGDIVAVGYDPNTGSSRDLTDDEMREVTEYFTNHSARRAVGSSKPCSSRAALTTRSKVFAPLSRRCLWTPSRRWP